MDPVGRVGDASHVVIGERDALNVAEQPTPESQDELLVDEGAEHRDDKPLKLTEQHDGQEEPDYERQQEVGRTRDLVGHERRDDPGQGAPADHTVDRDLQRERGEQCQRARQQAEQEQDPDERPAGSRLAEHPPENDDVGGSRHRLRRSLTVQLECARGGGRCAGALERDAHGNERGRHAEDDRGRPGLRERRPAGERREHGRQSDTAI